MYMIILDNRGNSTQSPLMTCKSDEYILSVSPRPGVRLSGPLILLYWARKLPGGEIVGFLKQTLSLISMAWVQNLFCLGEVTSIFLSDSDLMVFMSCL